MARGDDYDLLFRELRSAGLSKPAVQALTTRLKMLGAVAVPPAPPDVDHNVAAFYAKETYPTLGHVIDNPKWSELQPGEVDESPKVMAAAAYVVGDVAYWISGWDQLGFGRYFPFILRYDLASDCWLSSVRIPSPPGLPDPPTSYVPATAQVIPETADLGVSQNGYRFHSVGYFDVPAGIELQDLTLQFDLSAPLPDSDYWYIASVIVDAGHLYVIPGSPGYNNNMPHPYLYRLNGVVFNRDDYPYDQIASTAGKRVHICLFKTSDTTTVLPGTVQHVATTAQLNPAATQLSNIIGWGFEGGYYGAIGSKLYFGGGDANFLNGLPAAFSNSEGRQLMSYDTVTGQFTQLAVKPNGHDFGWFGVGDGKLYAGYHSLLDIYDPVTNTWSTHDLTATSVQGMNDWAQGVQVGRWLYWPDMGQKLNLDGDPAVGSSWVQLQPAVDPVQGPFQNWDGAVAVGQDGKIHYFAGTTDAAFHWILDPATDTWARGDDIAVSRYYFSAVQRANGDWRFIGNGTDVWGTVHTEVDPVVTLHNDLEPLLEAGYPATVFISGADQSAGIAIPLLPNVQDGRQVFSFVDGATAISANYVNPTDEAIHLKYAEISVRTLDNAQRGVICSSTDVVLPANSSGNIDFGADYQTYGFAGTDVTDTGDHLSLSLAANTGAVLFGIYIVTR